MITKKVVQEAGITWERILGDSTTVVCVLPNGRLLIGNGSTIGLEYADGVGEISSNSIHVYSMLHAPSWCRFSAFKLLPTGRVLADVFNTLTNVQYIGYSDDNGETWTLIANTLNIKIGNILIAKNGRLFANDFASGAQRQWYYSDDNGETWVQSFTGSNFKLCVTLTGRILKFRDSANTLQYSDDNGETWVDTNISWGDAFAPQPIVTSTGRIIVILGPNNSSYSIEYSDDNGESWHSTSYTWEHRSCTGFVITSTGRIIISIMYRNTSGPGFIYSDDNGVNWTLTNLDPYLLDGGNAILEIFNKLPNKALLAKVRSGGSRDNGIYVSKPVLEDKFPKYLDQKGAQEIVTQFKAYCDAKVGA